MVDGTRLAAGGFRSGIDGEGAWATVQGQSGTVASATGVASRAMASAVAADADASVARFKRSLERAEAACKRREWVFIATPVKYVLNKKLRTVPIEILAQRSQQRSECLDRCWPVLF